ncbi:T9SS type A sorting domain-containing protein [Flavobacteriaceae bacterium]|nr:T9SS type A sorting domain-containing protein [Flavobacteriaceae bacterium]
MKKIYILLLSFTISSLSFGQVFITEIADPNNDLNGRFIELYNAGSTDVDFTEGNGWQIDKYTNASATVSMSLDLTGTIAAGEFYLIGHDLVAGSFETIYGFAPNQLDNVNNGVAGSNGDDDLFLLDGSDAVVDAFGTPGVDNTGTCAEYEDGRAERLTTVTTGATTFDETEWNVWADSTVADCTSHVNAPRTAPADFDPGAWGTATCDFSMSSPSAVCDAITAGVDTYTATVNFSGGDGTYIVTADSGTVDLSAGDPTTDTTGTITITGVTEGTDVIINVTDGNICNVNYTVNAVSCIPALNLPLSESFTYSDGSLVGNSSWEHSGGATGNLLVVSEKAVVQHGTPDEDLFLPFTPVSGSIYFAFDFSVIAQQNPISGTDNEYFAHLKNDAYGYAARVDIVPPSAAGDFSVGIATLAGVANSTWATDFTFDTDYRVTVKYDQVNNTTDLWIDATAETDVSISGEIPTSSPIAVESFGLRQSDSDTNEGILIDNLTIAQTFSETLSSNTVSTMTDFKLYPNPVKSGFVNISSTGSETVQANVFDILGKQVLNASVANGRLNVSTLNTGVYIVKLTQGAATTTKKLIIQ